MDPVRPKPRNWWVIYIAAAQLCFVVGLTTGTSEDSRAWHYGAIIVVLGILAIWRISEIKL